MSTTLESPSPVKEPAGVKHKSTGQVLTIALAGNPNAGKTTLFNTLTGLRQRVANYPGVTVERKEGTWPLVPGAQSARLIDLPGLYSLDAASIDEQIARDVLTGQIAGLPAPDIILAVVDATNLERNLYLATQLLEYGRPLVIALTMIDLAERRGIEIDVERLARELGVPVVPVTASQRRGIDALSAAIIELAGKAGAGPGWRLSETAERELLSLSEHAGVTHARHLVLRDLYGEELPADTERRAAIEGARARLSGADQNWWQEPLLARYDWIEQITSACVRRGGEHQRATATERIDRILTHRIFGPLVLIAIMLLVFQTIFSWAALPMDLIDKGFGALGEVLRDNMRAGLLTDLLVDGVIAGVGGVLVFLPQILLLFFFITILEDTGYMARAAFLMDRLMRGVGLHGKAFMPLLSSFACAIPGIMATRTIENPKDRFATIMIAPFMSCSARLPVYALLIAAFFSTQKVFGVISVGALMIVSMYLLGIAVAVCVAWILKHTILKAPPPPLVLEMPPYRVPNLLTVAQAVWSRAWLFVHRAGTVILAISIILWALVTFPRSSATVNENATASVETTAERSGEREGAMDSAAKENEPSGDETGAQIRNSFAGRAGRFIEPLIAPLGFDWKMGIGLISSFAARETLVSTFSIVYNVGPDEDEGSPSLIDAVRNAKRPDGTAAWTPLVAVSMMVFFVLACQCMSTVAVVRRETNSWRWPLFMVGYMLVLAYVASLITFQGGRLLGFT
ncbi:MAG TPA: ferrous iron transport protein B [Pyrinomonadaceae bacterium]|jgi:ferrous iron transport protein B